jgi:hypothetical protein
MPDVILNIESHSIRNEAALKFILKDLKDGKYLVSFKPYKRRSLNQNAWLHAICPLIMQGLQDRGYQEIDTPLKAKSVLKTMFFKVGVSNGIEHMEVIQDTSETSKADFSARAERIIIWAKEYLNLDVAPPGEQINIFNE